MSYVGQMVVGQSNQCELPLGFDKRGWAKGKKGEGVRVTLSSGLAGGVTVGGL